MNCTELRARIDAALDDEMAPAERDRLDDHVRACAACRAVWREREALIKRVRAAPYHHAPADLRIFAQALGATGRPAPRRYAALAASLVLALALGALLGGGIVWHQAGMQSARALTAELVASHVRSQLVPGRLTDIASSDRHVVKPWFNGRLDFAPPVADFTTDGFPLMGGRLDYLGGRPVAALVYRHRQHIINVYIRPATDSDGEPAAPVTDRGYNLITWRRSGMEYWIVSDLNRSSLESFERILQRP